MKKKASKKPKIICELCEQEVHRVAGTQTPSPHQPAECIAYLLRCILKKL